MRCKKARQLICLYLAPDDSYLDPQDRRDLEAHLAACDSCRQDCEETAEGIALFRKYWHISPDTQALIDRAEEREAAGLPVDPFWRFRRLIEIGIPASAVAACLVVLVLGWWIMSSHSRRPNCGADVIASAEAEATLVIASANGGRIEPGAVIETQAGQIDRLTLNGRHTVVMNGRTRLSIEPLMGTGQVGYQVNLTLGEIYVHVAHDGNPFVVQTAHGRAVITGTTFDVKVAETGTTLTVAEGSVRFESEGGTVSVIAGQQSMIAAASVPPSRPVVCEATTLTAWTGAYLGTDPVGHIVNFGDVLADSLPVFPLSPDVRTDFQGIRYAEWVEQNRDWFRRRFPEAFRLADALAQEGVNVEYPDLLLDSGLVWQFAWPPASPERLLAADDAAIIKAAARHGGTPQWLKNRRLLPGPADPVVEQAWGMEAFSQWQKGFAAVSDTGGAVPTELLFDSLQACDHLRHTRALIWLAIEAEQYAPPEASSRQLRDLLRTEILIADKCSNDCLRLFTLEGSETLCECDPCRELVQSLCNMIAEIMAMEGRIANEMANCRP